MRRTLARFTASMTAVIMMIALLIPASRAQTVADEHPEEARPRFRQRNLSGPRIGFTFVPGAGQLRSKMKEKDMGRLVSQFGWQFERQVIPEGGGPRFLVEFIPLVAGVEYGRLLPTGTLAMGIRFPSGWEFGVGPNVMVVTDDSRQGLDDALETSLVIAVGKSFDYGGVSIPLNLAYSTNPDGDRLSFVFGYAIGHGKKPTERQDRPQPRPGLFDHR